ncbi:MAG: 6-bladed beta-propeller, partial [Candidatus Promineifilaceae bacterium]
ALVGFISFLLWWWLATWAVYSLAGEKMAWLSSHFVLPMALLGGWYMGERLTSGNWREVRSGRFLALTVLTGLLLLSIFLTLRPVIIGTARLGGVEQENLRQLGLLLGSLVLTAAIGYFVWRRAEGLEVGTLKRAFILAGFGLLALLTVRFSYMAAFPNGDYVTEFLVYAHGAPATKREVLDMLEELSMRLSGDKGVAVGFDNDAAWPYLWYLRDYPNRVYFGDNPQRSITESPILIVGSSSWTKVEPFLGDDYESWTYTFLWWPMEEYRQVSWNAIFGDPSTAAAERRGLGNPEVRRALWDIFFYRDYTRYGEVFGGTYTAGEWPLRHDLKVYVRRDVLASLWDRGTIAVAAEPPPDPYAGKDLAFNPSQVIGSPGSQAGQLQTPRNVALGPDGLIYVADTGNHRIQVFDADGRFVRGWGTNGRGQGQFNEPWGLAVDDEFVYVADTWNHRLQKFSLDGDFVAEIGRSGTPAEGQIGGGLFFGPRDILMRPDGNLLVTDTGNHRLQLLDPNGNFLQAVGGPRPGSELGSFSEPVGLAAGPDGTAFVADTWNGRIQQLSADLSPLTSWPVDAWFGQSTINKPYLATDEAGRLYVTDPEGYRVLIFDVAGAFLGRLGDYSTGSDGFGLPTGVAAGASGRIFVADAANGQILIFDDPLAAAPAGDG